MADLSHVVLPNNQEYDLKDATARTKIGTATLTTVAQDLSGAVNELVDAEVTSAEKNYWNDKITLYIDPNDSENLVFGNSSLYSIDATFTQGSNIIYETDPLSTLNQYLVVVATYSSGATETITDYILSGTLQTGTSIITATYGGKTDTFSVTVTSQSITYLYNWDFTQSLTDSVEGVTATLNSGSSNNDPTRTSEGIIFNEPTQYVYLGGAYSVRGKTIEYDVSSAQFAGNTSYHIRHLMLCDGTTSSTPGLSPFMWKKDVGWSSYGYTASTGSTTKAWSSTVWGDLSGSSQEVLDCMSGKTVKIVISSDGQTTSIYLNNTLIGTKTDNNWRENRYIFFGGIPSPKQSSGDQCYNLKLTGLRIYETEQGGE